MCKYKYKPTPGQTRLLAHTLLLCSRLYNTAIQQQRKRGRKRHAKAIQWLARKYQKVRRQCRDHQHKTVLALVREFDAIFYENLGVANLVEVPQYTRFFLRWLDLTSLSA